MDNSQNTRPRTTIIWAIAGIMAVAAVLWIIRGSTDQPAPTVASTKQQLPAVAAGAQQDRPLRILHVMSFHMPWEWTETQFQGFKDALSDLEVEYKVVQMDVKRDNSLQRWLDAAAEAKEIIETWEPDMLFTSDDAAQKYLPWNW